MDVNIHGHQMLAKSTILKASTCKKEKDDVAAAENSVGIKLSAIVIAMEAAVYTWDGYYQSTDVSLTSVFHLNTRVSEPLYVFPKLNKMHNGQL